MTLTKGRMIALVRLAQKQAGRSVAQGNAPFGAVLVDRKGVVVAQAHNTQFSDNDPSAHAEINLLRIIGKKSRKYNGFDGCTVVGNAEPCSMCSSACIKAGIVSFVFGAPAEPSMDPFLPVQDVAKKSKRKARILGGILAEECALQISEGRDTIEQYRKSRS